MFKIKYKIQNPEDDKGGSGGGGDWRSTLPEDIRDSETLKEIPGINELAKGYINAQQLVGNSIRIPSENASEEDRKSFYGKLMEKVPGLVPMPGSDDEEGQKVLWTKLGKPETDAHYTLPESAKDIPDISDFKKLAHQANLTQSQFETIIGGLAASVGERTLQENIDYEKGMRDLKVEWGLAYEDNIKTVDAVIRATNAPDHVKEAAADGKLSPEDLRWYHSVAKQLGSEGMNFDNVNLKTRMTPREAQAQIDEINRNNDHPYWNPTDPGHAAAKKQFLDLMRISVG